MLTFALSRVHGTFEFLNSAISCACCFFCVTTIEHCVFLIGGVYRHARIQAHNCVSATARAGAELGYNIYVVRDAVGDRHLPELDAALLVKVRERVPTSIPATT